MQLAGSARHDGCFHFGKWIICGRSIGRAPEANTVSAHKLARGYTMSMQSP